LWAILLKVCHGNKQLANEMDLLDVVCSLKVHSDNEKLQYELNRNTRYEIARWKMNEETTRYDFPTKFHYISFPWDGNFVEEWALNQTDEDEIDELISSVGKTYISKNKPNE